MKTANLQTGFSLIEVLVTMAILGAVTTSVLTIYTRSLMRSRDAQRKSDLDQIVGALNLYYQDHQYYPIDNGAGKINDGCVDTPTTPCAWGALFGSATDPYMKKLPTDPKFPSQEYFYRQTMSEQGYQLYAKLENEDDPQILTGAIDTPPDCAVSVRCNYGVSSTNEQL